MHAVVKPKPVFNELNEPSRDLIKQAMKKAQERAQTSLPDAAASQTECEQWKADTRAANRLFAPKLLKSRIQRLGVVNVQIQDPNSEAEMPPMIKAKREQIFVPFTGNADLFHLRTTCWSAKPLGGGYDCISEIEVKADEIIITLEYPASNVPLEATRKSAVEQTLRDLEIGISRLSDDFDSLDHKLTKFLDELWAEHKQKAAEQAKAKAATKAALPIQNSVLADSKQSSSDQNG